MNDHLPGRGQETLFAERWLFKKLCFGCELAQNFKHDSRRIEAIDLVPDA